MHFPNIASIQIMAATSGNLQALNEILSALQPGVFNLCIRMLGNRDEAADACQEVLLKVTTNLSTFRGQSVFTTWVYQITKNHVLTLLSQRSTRQELSFEQIADKLNAGIEYAQEHLAPDTQHARSAEDALLIKEIALSCTQSFLSALDPVDRVIYLLDFLFDLDSLSAAQVVELSSDAYRQRLSRAKAKLAQFIDGQCGLANPNRPCKCETQLPAVKVLRRMSPATPNRSLAADESLSHLDERLHSIQSLSDASEVLRVHPEYQAPGAQLAAIRAILSNEGWMTDRQH